MKDLTAFLDPDLILKLAGRTYTVPPPTMTVGLQLAAINAGGVAGLLTAQGSCPTCGRMGDLDVTPETAEILDQIGNTPLGIISLGQGVYDQMIADDIPEKHIDKAALYAMYYWVLGQSTADAIIEAQAEQSAGATTDPKGQKA